MIRAKFTVQEVTQVSWSKETRKVVLQAQYDPSIEEDRRFAKATPSGRVEMQIDNPSAAEFFALGKTFYVDFTEAVEVLKG